MEYQHGPGRKSVPRTADSLEVCVRDGGQRPSKGRWPALLACLSLSLVTVFPLDVHPKRDLQQSRSQLFVGSFARQHHMTSL